MFLLKVIYTLKPERVWAWHTPGHATPTFLQIFLPYWFTGLKQFFILIFSEHKICIVGLDNAGKTTILYQFLMNEVVHTSPTIGSNVEEVVWKNVHFIMWDLGGQESLRAAWNTYYSNTEVSCILRLNGTIMCRNDELSWTMSWAFLSYLQKIAKSFSKFLLFPFS